MLLWYNDLTLTNLENISSKKPFKDLQIYYSGSVKGVPEADPEFPWKLVQFIKQGGGLVLSEHVVARDYSEMREILTRRAGERGQKALDSLEPWYEIRAIDMGWLDEASHMIALVNSPSHGVGMEIERALLREDRGLKKLPLLALVKVDLLENLSFMIRGIKKDCFQLATYKNLPQAQEAIYNFLTCS